MMNDLPISPKKKFKYSITFQSFNEESLEAGDSLDNGYEIEHTVDLIGDILYEANTTYGIYMPVSFGTWESTEPEQDRDFFEKGISKYYALHLTNEDGTEISQEESDFISFLLSDGRYEIDKFRDYAVGGIVLGSIVVGIGALITYFYFKGKKPSVNKVQKPSVNKVVKTSANKFIKPSLVGRSKSVIHNINGKDRKFPIKDAWRKEHSTENKSENYEVPQEDRFEMGGDASEHYHEVEYGEGGVARAKEIITKKIGLNEENANYLVSQSEKFSIWLADAILKKDIKVHNDLEEAVGRPRTIDKKSILDFINKRNNHIQYTYSSSIRQILDWLQHPVTPKQNLKELSFDQALEKAREWHNELQVLGGDIDFTEPEKNTILKKYPVNSDGIEYYWVFIPSNYCDLESSRMGHCGRTGYGNTLISLRSVKEYGKGHTISDSHVTIAYGSDGMFYQVKGKKNNKPAEKYFPYIFDLIKTMLTDEEIKHKFNEDDSFTGFGNEYQSSEDYGFEDMTKKQIREIYDLNPQIFEDAKSILILFDEGVITTDEFKEIVEREPDTFSSFGNQMKLYEKGIKSEQPSTSFELNYDCDDVYRLLDIDRDFSDDLVAQVLCGDVGELSDSFSYYYDNPSDLVSNLNKENEQKVIDEIVRITKLDESVVKENGIEHYLSNEDDDFPNDNFDNIIRTLASAQNQADNNDYYKYLYDAIESALNELGEVHSLNDTGVKMTIDLINSRTFDEIAEEMDYYEFSDVADLFNEKIGDEIEKPRLSIDDRYSPYGSREDFNDYVSDTDLEQGYKKGGYLREKNINKNMKTIQTKLKAGGDLGYSKEDYFLVVKNWVYFTFNYPMGFVKDAFGSSRISTHLQEKFSSSYERFGSYGVLISFWGNLDGNNREILSLWIKNNYLSFSEGKTELQSISDDNYAKIITHWNMFCFNFDNNFVEKVFEDNSEHFENKWVRSYERAGSTGAVNKFFTELSGNNQRLLTDWVYDNHKHTQFADGGRVTTNDGIIEAFLTSNKQLKVGNLATHFNEYDNEMLLRNYGTLIATRKANDVSITNTKYSKTTTIITNKVNRMALDEGMNVNNTDKFAYGGSIELETWREDGVSENEKMDSNSFTRSEVKNVLKELGYNVTEDNFNKFHKKEHFDYIKEKDVFYRNDVNDEYADGGRINSDFYKKFGDENSKLVNFDLSELDDFEEMQYNHISKSSSKADTLQVLINNVEGDYSQLSDNLSEIAEEQYPSDEFFEDNRQYAEGGKAGDKSVKRPIRKKRQPKVARTQFEEQTYEYKKGGETGREKTINSKGVEYIITLNPTGDFTDTYNLGINRYSDEFGGSTHSPMQILSKSEAERMFQKVNESNAEDMYRVFAKMPTHKNKKFADGGSTDLDYSDIFNVLKSKIDDSIDEMPMDYENSSSFTSEEIEHESRDGFIPYTDGGYQAVWFEYLSGMWGAGRNLPTKQLDDEMNRQIDYNLDSAKENFIKNYPEIVEELGKDNIDYNSLYEAGYGEEAEELSNDEMEMMSEDTIMMRVFANYYNPENSRAKDGKHTIRLFGDVNLESPYHRTGNLDDSYEFEFTFDSIDVLETEMAIGIAKILSWFEGDMYNDSDAEMKVRRMKKGGRLSDKATYLGKRDIESIRTVYGQTIAGEKLLDGNYVKGKLNKPKMSRLQFEEETYEYKKGGSVKGIKKKAEKLLEDSINYRFKNTDMGSGWLFQLESPLNKNVFNLLEEQLYLDEFSPDDMGIEDYDELSEQEQDYYYEDWKEELFQSSFEAFKEKCKKHLDDFIEYIQQAKEYQDEMNEYAKGGKADNTFVNVLLDYDFIETKGHYSIRNFIHNSNGYFAFVDMKNRNVEVFKDAIEGTNYSGFSIQGLIDFLNKNGFTSGNHFSEGGEAGYSKKERVIDYYYQNDIFDDYETYGLSEDDLNNEDTIVKAIIKYHGLENPENVDERFETLFGDDEDEYAGGGFVKKDKLQQARDYWKELEGQMSAKQKKFYNELLKKRQPSFEKNFNDSEIAEYINGEIIEQFGVDLGITKYQITGVNWFKLGFKYIAYREAIEEPEFWEEMNEYAEGGEAGGILELYLKDKFSEKDYELIEEAIENGDIDTTSIKEDFLNYAYNRMDGNSNEEEAEKIRYFLDEIFENMARHKENYDNLIEFLKSDDDNYAEGGLIVKNNTDLEEVAKYMTNAVKKHRWDLKDLIHYFEKENNFDYKKRVKIWEDMNGYEMKKTYNNIYEMLKRISEANGSKFAGGGDVDLWKDLSYVKPNAIQISETSSFGYPDKLILKYDGKQIAQFYFNMRGYNQDFFLKNSEGVGYGFGGDKPKTKQISDFKKALKEGFTLIKTNKYAEGGEAGNGMSELHSELIGISISHATLKTEHLISAFMDFLNSKKSELNSEIVNRIDKIQSEINTLEIDEDGDYVGESEEIAVSIVNEDIFDLMNDIAPDGTYFGTTEGDGSDFGFWLIDDDENDDDDYAEGGEIQDWMEEALVSLIEETGNDDLEITIVADNGNEFYATDENVEYRVFKTEDDAEEKAIEGIREDMEESPENFNQDFLVGYIDGKDFFKETLDEMNYSYAEDIASESDSKYANRLIAELVENGLMDEDDAQSDNAEELADNYKDDFVSLMTDSQLDEGNNGLNYFIANFGEEETYQMVRDNNLIDIDSASRDAVNSDGIAHFLSSYDGETLYLSNDYVAYRVN